MERMNRGDGLWEYMQERGSLRSNERASVVVGKATDDNEDDVDDVPDTESTS
jgi:hypothetical protein